MYNSSTKHVSYFDDNSSLSYRKSNTCNTQGVQTMDSVKFITKYLGAINAPIITNKKDREKQIHEWIVLYRDTTLPDEDRFRYRDYVLYNVFYLFPYILAKRRLRFSLFDEAIQQLILSTITAIDKYDYKNYSKFTAYLAMYITDAMNICIQGDAIITIPSSTRKRLLKQNRELLEDEDEKRTNLGVEPSYVFVKGFSDASLATPYEGTVSQVLPCSYRGEEYFEEQDYAPSTMNNDSLSVCDILEKSEYLRTLEFALSEQGGILSERERLVITYRFGIFGAPKLTLKQVSELFHSQGWRATIEWIFQLEKRAIKKINKFMGQCGITQSFSANY